MIHIRFRGFYSFLLSTTFFMLTFYFFPMISYSQIKEGFYPEGYDYPSSSLKSGKTFVYRNENDSSDFMFVDYKMVNENGKKYVITRQYNQTSTFDSLKYTENGKLIESYIYFTNPVIKLKGKILQNEVADNGTRLGVAKAFIEYTSHNYPDYMITLRGEEWFLKDTVFNWHGQKLECLKTMQIIQLELENEKDPLLHHNTNRVGQGYYAKGIGLVRYHVVTSTRESSTMVLIEIRDMGVSKGK